MVPYLKGLLEQPPYRDYIMFPYFLLKLSPGKLGTKYRVWSLGFRFGGSGSQI